MTILSKMIKFSRVASVLALGALAAPAHAVSITNGETASLYNDQIFVTLDVSPANTPVSFFVELSHSVFNTAPSYGPGVPYDPANFSGTDYTSVGIFFRNFGWTPSGAHNLPQGMTVANPADLSKSYGPTVYGVRDTIRIELVFDPSAYTCPSFGSCHILGTEAYFQEQSWNTYPDGSGGTVINRNQIEYFQESLVYIDVNYLPAPAPVPVPFGAPMLAGALIWTGFVARRKSRA